ncbi:MAG: N-acetylmuramoyl-L-alanine amidase [Clostridia bacterium]|nr:N-acetylmuramoyl-L-alanine amidase [Clostridia bacterium]
MKRLWIAAVLLLTLALACSNAQEAEAPDSPAPTDAPVTQSPPDTPEPTEEAVVIETPEPTEEATLPPAPTPEPTPTPAPPLAGIRIGIDPGHQAEPDYDTEPIAPDSEEQAPKCVAGTRGIVSDVYEHEVNLRVAVKLKKLLEAQGAKVFLSRGDREQIGNMDRAEFFNAMQVDLAVELHCNGSDDPDARGAFMIVPAVNRTQFYSENVRAATEILSHYCAATGLSSRKHNGITYRSDRTVFNWCTRPIVCIEMGYLSNETEDLLLTNDKFQDKMSFGICEGIIAYFRPESNPEGGTP